MLVLTDLTTKQLIPDEITVEWFLQSSSEDFNGYRLAIYRAAARMDILSEYDLVASGINPATVSTLQDTGIYGVTNKFVDYFYKMVISGLSGQGVFVSDPYQYIVQVDKYAREIYRRRALVFNLHSGQDYHILKRKEFGTLCNVCYDPTLQRTTKSKCTTCYDTGYVGGYFTDIHIKGQLSERPVREMHQMFGQWQDSDAVFYCPAVPPLNPKDIVVDRLTRRWIVLNVNSYGKALYTIGQICQLRQIEKDDVVNKYPITY